MPWDNTDTQILYAVRDSSEFQDDTFRTIPMVKDKPRVWGIVGKPKGGGGMALQAVRFPKEDGWTLEQAKDWVREHRDSLKEGDMRETKDYRFEVKEVSDEGTFTGTLSVYGVTDLGGDCVDAGAFTKTLQESGGSIPCLWHHSDPIGSLEVHDNGVGLEVKGKLVMAVEKAREAHALMKAGVVKGLSIGYRTIKSKVEDGVRHLKELALMEGSIVTFPMLPLAQVASVKSAEQKAGFADALERRQTWDQRYQMMSALSSSLDNCFYDDKMTDEEIGSESESCIDEFKAAYMGWLPKMLGMMAGKSRAEFLETKAAERKAGRKISADTRAAMDRAMGSLKRAMSMASEMMDKLSGEKAAMDMGAMHDAMAAMMGHMQRAMSSMEALMDEEAGEPATSKSGAAEQHSIEPEALHSALKSLADQLAAGAQAIN